MRAYKLTIASFLTALAVVIHYVESFIPSVIPGFRLGLANVVSVFALLYLGPWFYFAVVFLRIILVGLLFTGFGTTFMLSLGGALFSSAATILLYYLTKTSVFGISTVGAFFHVLGQIVVYILIVSTPYMILYLPLLAALAMVSGFLLSFVVAGVISALPPLERLAGVKRKM